MNYWWLGVWQSSPITDWGGRDFFLNLWLDNPLSLTFLLKGLLITWKPKDLLLQFMEALFNFLNECLRWVLSYILLSMRLTVLRVSACLKRVIAPSQDLIFSKNASSDCLGPLVSFLHSIYDLIFSFRIQIGGDLFKTFLLHDACRYHNPLCGWMLLPTCYENYGCFFFLIKHRTGFF